MGLVMLDLDGTLVEDAIVEIPKTANTDEYVLGRRQHELYSEPTLKPHVYERLRECAHDGDSFAIVTNQGGVALGYHTQAEVYARISKTCALLSMFWGRPFSVHVAWMMPSGYVPGFKGDDGRKPAANMLLAAMGNAIGLSGGPCEPGAFVAGALPVMVGDRAEDEQAAEVAGVSFKHAGDYFGW